MNAQETQQWLKDAAVALSGKYDAQQIAVILDWFETIRGGRENDLIGEERVNALVEFAGGNTEMYSLYDFNMARMWIYAPYILRSNSGHNISTATQRDEFHFTREGCRQWEIDAAAGLSMKYDPEQVKSILSWFRTIKGAEEADLLGGYDRLSLFMTFSNSEDEVYSLYDNLMSRLWLYAPYILKEEAVERSRREISLS